MNKLEYTIMKKLTFILSFILTFSSVCFAQHSEKAKALLDDVSKKVKSYDNIEIEFSYVLENTAENIKQETRGDVALKDEKYRLNLMGTTRLFDGQKLYTIIPEDEEINISTYNPEDSNGITPSEMLTFYEDGYTYNWDIKQNVKGRKIQYVKLTPIDSDAEVKEILLGIDVQTKHIYNLIQKQDNGTKVTIKVNSFKTNQPLSENLFKFNEDKYQGYYINRLD
ncbi:Outer-membrane lipoprotein carrier protein [Mesonia oceanica]|uniref:Outer-membrane lipoprotein carrier protein n=1 Tax=Mesonia oceanica TaxID=2687242 RepID=A0AC61YCW7_9FLAO|nr:Outer-membrane lipoprotein carrier protein [Mesonia oceanica]|tara:strand:- start:118544 stop:119215 length:672 start_codon:yes stop_codon:yes gene_type:complete